MVMLWFFSFSFLPAVGCGCHGGACGLYWWWMWWIVVATMVVIASGVMVGVVEEVVAIVFCVVFYYYLNKVVKYIEALMLYVS